MQNSENSREKNQLFDDIQSLIKAKSEISSLKNVHPNNLDMKERLKSGLSLLHDEEKPYVKAAKNMKRSIAKKNAIIALEFFAVVALAYSCATAIYILTILRAGIFQLVNPKNPLALTVLPIFIVSVIGIIVAGVLASKQRKSEQVELKNSLEFTSNTKNETKVISKCTYAAFGVSAFFVASSVTLFVLNVVLSRIAENSLIVGKANVVFGLSVILAFAVAITLFISMAVKIHRDSEKSIFNEVLNEEFMLLVEQSIQGCMLSAKSSSHLQDGQKESIQLRTTLGEILLTSPDKLSEQVEQRNVISW